MSDNQQSNQKKNSNILLIVLLLAAAVLFGFVFYNSQTAYKREPVTSTDFLMDTLVEQRVYGKKAKEATVETAKRLRDFENTYSMYVKESVVSKINKNAGVKPTQLTEEEFAFFEETYNLCEQTGGQVDVTIAPVVTLWGVTGNEPKVPKQEELKEALKKVDYKKMELNKEAKTVFLKEKGMAIDLGAVAKGKACDIVKEVYKEYDVIRGYISLGGNIYSYNQEEKVHIRDPFSKDMYKTIGYFKIEEQVVATSGAYERNFEVDGVEYHHIFDKKTGYPAQTDLGSVTVVASNGALADTMSTALFGLGSKGLEAYKNDSRFQFVAVTKDGEVILSSGMEQNFVKE